MTRASKSHNNAPSTKRDKRRKRTRESKRPDLANQANQRNRTMKLPPFDQRKHDDNE